MIPKAALINDLSGLGKCSLVAQISVFSCLGVQACPLPTAVLTNQTGYDSFYMDDYTDKMPRYIEEWKKREIGFDGIVTGFLAGPGQIDHVEAFLEAFRTVKTTVVVDPVMGDNGHIYSTFTPALCDRIRHLVLRADVITPNLTEACILLGREPVGTMSVREAGTLARRLAEKGPERVVLTGVKDNGYMHNVILDRGQLSCVSVPSKGESYSGTGDLMTSVVAAGLIQGRHSLHTIVESAADFIRDALIEAVADGTDRNDGIAYERYLWKLGEKLT